MTKKKRTGMMGWMMALSLTALLLAGCGKSEFGLTENTGKAMAITARKADKGDFFMAGSLEVEEGEQIVLSSGLEKGSVRVEIIGTPAEQSIDEVPDFAGGDPIITADLRTSEGASGTVPAGSYMLKATCLEKATGTVKITVEPAS